MKPPRRGSEAVFFNFPFDEQYRPLRDVIVFTIAVCGFAPVCALDAGGSGNTRLDKILRMIRESRLSIHDLSRTDAGKRPRYNMPFECGICIGAQHFAMRKKLLPRECFVLGRTLAGLRACMSDLAGNDIGVHKNNPPLAVRLVREWLDRYAAGACLGEDEILRLYKQFHKKLPALCAVQKINPEKLSYPNFLNFVWEWLDKNAEAASPLADDAIRPHKNRR